MSTGGEVANALVCKTSIRGFNSLPVLQKFPFRHRARGIDGHNAVSTIRLRRDKLRTIPTISTAPPSGPFAAVRLSPTVRDFS